MKFVRQRNMIALLIGMAFIFCAGTLAWYWQEGQRGVSHAEDPSVLGPTRLDSTLVNSIFQHAGSPMNGTGDVVVQASRETNIDAAFALAVWWAETNDGAAGVGINNHNPGGVRSSSGYPVDSGNFTVYPSYGAAIEDWFQIVKSRYIDRGLTTVASISGPYVGGNTGSWVSKVINYMNTYRAQAPEIRNGVKIPDTSSAPQITLPLDTANEGARTQTDANVTMSVQEQPASSAPLFGWLALALCFSGGVWFLFWKRPQWLVRLQEGVRLRVPQRIGRTKVSSNESLDWKPTPLPASLPQQLSFSGELLAETGPLENEVESLLKPTPMPLGTQGTRLGRSGGLLKKYQEQIKIPSIIEVS